MSIAKNISLTIRVSRAAEPVQGSGAFSHVVSCIRNCFSLLFLEVLHAVYR